MRLKDTDKLIELIDDDIASLDKNMSQEGYDVCLCTLEMVKQYIEALPTVEAEPIKHGRWVHKYGDGHEEPAITGGECSICGYVHTATNYCPNCGAKMQSTISQVKRQNAVNETDEVEE